MTCDEVRRSNRKVDSLLAFFPHQLSFFVYVSGTALANTVPGDSDCRNWQSPNKKCQELGGLDCLDSRASFVYLARSKRVGRIDAVGFFFFFFFLGGWGWGDRNSDLDADIMSSVFFSS